MTTPLPAATPLARSVGALPTTPLSSRLLRMPPPPPPLTPGRPGLDRVLDLVTEHETHYRHQELRMAELAKRIADCEAQLDPGNGELWEELGASRAAAEAAQRQASAFDGEARAHAARLEVRLDALSAAAQRSESAGGGAARRLVREALAPLVERVAAQLEGLKAATDADVAAVRAEHARAAEAAADAVRRAAQAGAEAAALRVRVGQLCDAAAQRDAAAARAERQLRDLRSANATLTARVEELAAASARAVRDAAEAREQTAQLAEAVAGAMRTNAHGGALGLTSFGYGAYAPRSLGAAGITAPGGPDLNSLDSLAAAFRRRSSTPGSAPRARPPGRPPHSTAALSSPQRRAAF